MKKRPDLNTLVSLFISDRRSQNVTDKTIQWHSVSLHRFARYCMGAGLDIYDLDATAIREYIRFLQHSPGRNGNLTESSVATYVRSLKAFLSWLVQEEYLESDPSARVAKPKVGEKSVELFSDQELKRLLAVCSGPYGARDEAIVRLLLDTGLRASEVTTALLEDVDEAPPSLTVSGKGRKRRRVPLGVKTVRAIRRYIRTRDDDYPCLFLGKRGEPLTPNGLYQLLERRGAVAGIHANPHKFRHTFAVSYLRNGGGIADLQKILGHTTLEMVLHYARLADRDVADKHRLYSPGDRL